MWLIFVLKDVLNAGLNLNSKDEIDAGKFDFEEFNAIW